MNRRILFAFALTVTSCAIVSASISRSVKTNRSTSAAPISRVCFVSLNAKLTRIGMKGAEPLPSESDAWAVKLGDMVRHALGGSGLTLAGDYSATGEIANDQTRQSIERVRQKYDTIAALLNKKPGKVNGSRYTLGDEVALAPCSADADALLFVDASGAIATTGRKTFSFFVAGVPGLLMSQSNFRVGMAFVDAKTGQVVAFTRIAAMGDKTGRDPERVLDERLTDEFGKMRTAGKP